MHGSAIRLLMFNCIYILMRILHLTQRIPFQPVELILRLLVLGHMYPWDIAVNVKLLSHIAALSLKLFLQIMDSNVLASQHWICGKYYCSDHLMPSGLECSRTMTLVAEYVVPVKIPT